MKRQIIIGHFITLFLGGLVYLSFRKDTLRMFKWFHNLNLSEYISNLRLFTLPLSEFFPNWFLYSLPDGLWLFSCISILLVIWNNTISSQNIYWLILIPSISIISEIGQYFLIFPGTFDIFDLIFYIGGSFLPLLIFTNSKSINFKSLWKKYLNIYYL